MTALADGPERSPGRVWSRTTQVMGRALGRQVSLARRRKRWSEVELAQRARISRSTVLKIESGAGNVALNAVIEICWLLEVPLLGVTGLSGAEVLLRQAEADLALMPARVRARRGDIPSDEF